MLRSHSFRDFLPLIIAVVLVAAITCGKLFLPSSPGSSAHDYDAGYSNGRDDGYSDGYDDAQQAIEEELSQYFTDGYYEGYQDALRGLEPQY